jgi:hypothetical protein
MFAVLIGPYIKKGYMSPRRYSFPSILKTIELILGFPPLNQNDAHALALTDCFTNKPDFAPYTALPVSMEYWANSVLQMKSMERAWCNARKKMFSGPHPLCTWNKFPSPRYDDD